MIEQHFAEPGFVFRAGWVTDEEYERILDQVVVSCVDCILVHAGRMLVGLRTQEPYRGWWVIGGRMRPGESFAMTGQRVVERELGLHIPLSRFCYVSTISYVWARRAQPSPERGCHMIGNNLLGRLSDAEVSAITATPDFAELKWIDPRDVVQSSEFHPAIKQFAQHVLENP